MLIHNESGSLPPEMLLGGAFCRRLTVDHAFASHLQRLEHAPSLSLASLGFCEPITKNEKIEKESELNGNRPGRVSRLHDGPDRAGKPRLGSATGNVPGVASAIPENGLRCPPKSRRR